MGGTGMDEEHFLQAISASPDDNLVRLVYADWLDERGDPRAEFVRLQVELRQLPPDDHLTDISHAPLVTWEPRGLLLCVATTERAHPFSGNPNIEPRPTDDPPSREPIEPLWLVMFGSLIVGGIVAVQRRLSARSG